MIAPRSRSSLFGHTAVLVASGGLLLSLAACGGAEAKAPDAMKVGEPPEREPTSIEEAQQRIASAKAELAAGSGTGSDTFARPPPRSADAPAKTEASPTIPPGASTSVPLPSTTPLSPAQRPSEPAPPKAARNAEDRCASPCRALASMRHAVTALCRMTGTEDARCLDAKHTLSESESRIAPCSC